MTSSQRKIIEKLRQKKPKRILFVCLGNICRSPAAEGMMKKKVMEHDDIDGWIIDSAGTGRWHVGGPPDRRMRVHARRRDIELDHICRTVRADDFDYFDLIIGMDSMNLSDLRQMAPTIDAEDKIIGMSEFVDSSFGADHIPDPYYDGDEGFERVLDLLENGCENLYQILK